MEPKIKVKVIDQGIGIEPGHLTRIFKPFHMSPTRGQILGNGVGLSICKQICEQFGGGISVESEKDIGSTFTFTMQCQLNKNAKLKKL